MGQAQQQLRMRFDQMGKNMMDKLGLSWAKLSHSWGLKLELEVEV